MGFNDGGSRGGGFRNGGGFRRGGGGFRRGFNDRPREMHKIVCKSCGKEDQVPFKPRDDKDVFCKDCYFKSKGIEPRQPRDSNPAQKPAEKSEDASEDMEAEEEVESEDEY